MIDNKKEEYAHAINRYTKNIIDGLIPKRIVPFDYYEERDVDEEVKNWIESNDGEFAVIVGDAGFGKTSLLCNLANKFFNEEQYTFFFVKSENLRGKDFDKKILEDLEITETGLNAFLRRIIDENKKIIFLLDTLDVIATDDGIARLDDFLIKVKGENRVVIGASRPLEFKKIEHLTKKTLELNPFSDDEIRRLFDKYKAFYKMEGVELRLPVLEVCRNPLHMRMLFEVYKPNEILETINTQLLYDAYWNKKVSEIRHGALSYLDEGKKNAASELKEKLTKKIAIKMFTSRRITLGKVNIDKIKEEREKSILKINQHAEITNSESVTVNQNIKNIKIEYNTIVNDAYNDLMDEGVLREEEGKIGFFHQSFFEYAVARSIIEEDEQNRRELLEDLLSNITSLEKRAIIQQIILYAKRREEDSIAYKFLKKLSKTNLYAKILAIDLLKQMDNITEKEVAIYQILTKDEIEIREYLAESLKDVIPTHTELATRLIETLCKDEDVGVRRAASEALPKLLEVNPELATGLLETFSTDKESGVRIATAEALLKLVEVNPELATSLLETFCKDGDYFVQRTVAKALLKLVEVNPEQATELIKNLSKDKDVRVRRAVAEPFPKLAEVNPELATGLFETFSTDKESDVRRAAAEALPKLLEVNPELATRLIEISLKDADYWGVQWVVASESEALPKLLEVNPEVATELIVTFSKYEDWRVRLAAAKALPKLVEVNLELATGLIETLSRDESGSVRGSTSEALPKLLEVNPELTTKLIETLSRDVSWNVRIAALEALTKLFEAKPEVVTGLIENLSKDGDWLDVRRRASVIIRLSPVISTKEIPEPPIRLIENLSKDKFVEVHPEFATRLIETLCKDEDVGVRRAASKALPKLLEVNPEVATRLIETFTLSRDEDVLVHENAADALPKLLEVNPEVATELIETLCEGKGRGVEIAIRALPKLLEVNPEVATRLIETLSKNESGRVRVRLAVVVPEFFEINQELATRLIETLAKDEDLGIRFIMSGVISVLAELDPQKARPLVEKFKNVEDIHIQRAIAKIDRRGLLKGKI